jgi:polyferredoxin
MTRTKKTLIILLFTAVFAAISLLFFENFTGLFGSMGHNLLIYIAYATIIINGLFFKIRNKKKYGIPSDDEYSRLVKYKSGYYAFYASLYLWIFILILSNYFPNTQAMLGGGLILTTVFAIISYLIAKKEPNEE